MIKCINYNICYHSSYNEVHRLRARTRNPRWRHRRGQGPHNHSEGPSRKAHQILQPHPILNAKGEHQEVQQARTQVPHVASKEEEKRSTRHSEKYRPQHDNRSHRRLQVQDGPRLLPLPHRRQRPRQRQSPRN